MLDNQIKKLLTLSMIVFSLFFFANPVVDTNFFDTSSEKVLDLEEDIDQENDDEAEKNKFLFFNNFSFRTLFTCKPYVIDTLHVNSYKNNISLFKPPIHIS